MIKEKAYAKINLALEVRGKMEDGYHEVTNLMIPIDLYDELTFEECSEGIKFISNVPIRNNFVLLAAKLFLNTYKIGQGVKITLLKNIPLSSGLAGGSSDASATLRGLNRLFNTNISLDELSSLSSVLGSDMPYCVYQEIALCHGRGEVVELLGTKYEEIPCTLISPSFGISTKSVYEKYQYKGLKRADNINNIIKALEDGSIKDLENNIFNDLTDVTFELSKELKNIYNILSLRNKVYMSGSGPTLYILGNEVFDLDCLDKKTKIIKTKLKMR